MEDGTSGFKAASCASVKDDGKTKRTNAIKETAALFTETTCRRAYLDVFKYFVNNRIPNPFVISEIFSKKHPSAKVFLRCQKRCFMFLQNVLFEVIGDVGIVILVILLAHRQAWKR